jgi:hypothetical protein
MQPFYSTMPKAERDRRDATLARLRKKFPSLALPTETKAPRKFPAPVLWHDAEAYRHAGFSVVPVELGQVQLGREFPAAQGIVKHATAYNEPSKPADFAVGIVPSIVPIQGKSLADALATRSGIVRVNVAKDKGAAAEVLAVVERYLPGAPVRLALDSPSALVPFRIDPQKDPHEFRHFNNPTSDAVFVETLYACFLAGGDRYRWRGGVDLLATGRAGLPLLSVEEAAQMFAECRVILNAHAPAPKLTAEQKRRAAIAARAARR